ncbi:poly(U)-specific endoribonuclease [Paragonimus westermani]|uniref:Uridylate-specific endoribonuclease n=1 Tax=Paragonimus westermani TaxID=34504 RepID=A0A5J4NYU9_9TREM|nr:poly(U)-specific endoribonuclease [Paragonimus westermani]
MRLIKSIPRGLPLPLLDELSILFSDYFVRHIKTSEIYLELNRVNWSRSHNHEQLPLLPPHLTAERVFHSDSQQSTQTILMQWEEARNREQLIDQFLAQLFQARLFGEVFERISDRGVLTLNRSEFERAFRQVWFGQYSWNQMSRDAPNTCGFQHVYIGEHRKGDVKGLHHWARYYILEKTARLALQAVLKKHHTLQLASLRFTVDNIMKRYGTIFFGIPIEFEILIFFCAFLVGGSRDVNFMIDGERTTVVCYDVATRADVLATAYFKY